MEVEHNSPIPAVACMIEDSEGRWLLGQRIPSGLWQLPGGKIELGETMRDAVTREIKEEVGIEIESCSFVTTIDAIWKLSHKDKERIHHFVVSFFCANSWKGTPREIESDKCKEWKWLFPWEIPEDCTSALKEFKKEYPVFFEQKLSNILS